RPAGAGRQTLEPQRDSLGGLMIDLDFFTEEEEEEARPPHNHLYLDLEYVWYDLDKEELIVTWSAALDLDPLEDIGENLDNLLILKTDLWLVDLELTYTEAAGLKKRHRRWVQRQNIKLTPQVIYSQTERFHCQFSDALDGEIELRYRYRVICFDWTDHSIRELTENIKYVIDWDDPGDVPDIDWE
ncbi:MAG TPA: hypothetical protein VJT09_05540, partial [Pyrinomonadaceae bacterium]|nr:hypothetical protein [Pyrinomonadaceae bacterium]